MIDRRQFVLAVVVTALVAPLVSLAQQPKVPRVGILISETVSGQASRVDALRAGLRDHGYIEGKNIAIEIRSADGNYDRLPELAAELTRLKVDVIVAVGTKAVLAAMHATTTIPIVDPVMSDPVALGLSNSLARPGGNVTGSAGFGPEAYAKRLQFLKEAVPRITRVGVLVNPANTASAMQVQAMRAAANALKLELQVLEVRTASEFGNAFVAMAQGRIEAILVATDTLFRAHYIEIADLAGKQTLPSTGTKEFAAAGGLLGYGVDDAEMYRRAAYFVDRILKGAKPDDLPIEQATKLELILNLRTAKALGLAIPQSLLLRADEVIE
jgi:putative tryptophan/tyrosine transport system substrate-binding protein